MAANSTSFLERKVDQLFASLNAKPGDCCRNPVTGVGFVPGFDPAAPQKDEAVRALHASVWFAANGPAAGDHTMLATTPPSTTSPAA